MTGAGASGNLSTRNVQTGQLLATVGGLAVGTGNSGAALASNYTALATAGSSVSVTPANLTASTVDVIKTYDGGTTAAGTPVATAGTLFSGDLLAGGTFAFAGKDVGAGHKTVTVAGITVDDGNGGANYALTLVDNITSTINPATLTLSGTRVYDGTTVFAGANLTATGVSGESFAVTGAGASGNLTTKNVQTGQLLASVTGLAVGAGNTGAAVATNYNVLATSGSSVSVTAAPLTVSALDVVKTYDGGTSATGTAVVTAGTLFSGDMLAFGPFGPVLAFVGKDVGLGDKTVTLTGVGVNDGHGGANYALTLADNTTSTINPANLTLSGTRVYDGTTVFAGANLTATGVNGETFAVTGAGASGNLSTRNVQASQLLASVSGLAVGAGNSGAAVATNYNALAATGSSVSVTPASLTASSLDVVKTYDGGTTALGTPVVTIGTLFGGDLLAGGTFAFSGKDVGIGNKTVTVAGITVNDGNSGANYALTMADNTTSTINPANLSLSGTRVYDGTTTFAGSNLIATGVNGETFTVTGAGASGNLSTRNVQTGQLLASVDGLAVGTGNSGAAVATNYNALAATGSSVSVTPASLTASSLDVIKTYDGGTTALGAPVVTLGTLFGGDLLAGGTFAFVGKDVGAGHKTVTVAGITVNDGNSGANYLLTLADNITSTINPANLSLSGTRVYDGTTTFAGSNLIATGVNGETFAVTGAGVSGNLGTRNVQTGQLLASVGGLAVGAGNSGAAVASNYNALATTDSSVSVTPASLTASSLDVVKTYDGGTTALGTPVVTVGTLFGGDLLAGGTFAFSGKDVGIGNKTVTVAGIAVNDGNSGNNYTLAQVDNTTSTINRANLTLSGTRVFDGTTVFAGSNLTASGVNGESFGVTGAGVSGNLSSRNVQTSQPLASVSGLGTGAGNTGAALASNYNGLTTTGSTVSVTPAPLTITAEDKSKVYGAVDPLLTATYAGLVPSDDTSVVSGLTLTAPTGPSATAGAHPIVAAGAAASNYALTLNDGTLTVTPAPVTVNADGQTKIYGNVDPALTFVAGPLQYADTVADVFTGALTRAAGETVTGGPYQIGSGTLAAGSNYTLVYTGNELTITPRPVTLVPNPTTKVYGAIDPALSVNLTAGTLGAATVSDTLADVTGTLGRQDGENVGLYDVKLGTGARAANYTITFAADNDAFAITPATLTYVADPATRLVNTSNPVFSGAVTGFAFSETLATATTGTPVFDTPATVASPVGSYAINGSGLTANFGNYVFVQAPSNATAFTITSLPPLASDPLTITADNKSKIYGAALPPFTASFAGFVNGDTPASVTGLQFSTTATMGSNVGTYTITPFGALAPANYVVGYVPGTLTVSRAPLTVTADNISRLFGATTPPFTASVTGLVNGDTSAVVTGLTFGTAPTGAPDTFTIMPLSAVAANYSPLFVSGTLHVIMPTVLVGPDELPVTLVGGEPAITPEFAVVDQQGSPVLVARGDPDDNSYPPGKRLQFTLTEATSLQTFENGMGGTASFSLAPVSGTNFGSFELVASLPEGGSGRSDSTANPEPGLFRESSINRGGFNVIYHEALTAVREQRQGNSALGSSYREFSDSDNPQVNLVRTKVERKRGETTATPGGSGSL
ncbi:MAG: MBG domain-containing protein [Lacunisphaera sp.]